jgi:hypothetical protein
MAASVAPPPTVTIGHLDIDLVPAPSAKPAPGARRPQPPRATRGLPARSGFRYGFGQL